MKSSIQNSFLEPMVFCIGFQKTGTSSMGRALTTLGYKVRGWLSINEPRKEKRFVQIRGPVTISSISENCIPLLQGYNAAQDTPWYLIYKQLDEKFHRSKFILTLRDEEAWFDSLARHYGNKEASALEYIYGKVAVRQEEKEHFLRCYLTHNADVQKYFIKRSHDLLVADISKMSWTSLCGFLGKPEPVLKSFPHVNSGWVRSLKKTFKF